MCDSLSLPQFFDAYETALRRANAVDFDDLLSLPVAIFRDNPQELQRWRSQFTQARAPRCVQSNRGTR
jgi:ATP-dependent DNA helicase Rep